MIYNHELKLNSSKYLQINKNLIPTGKFKNVKKSIYDFSNFENIGKKLDYFKNKKLNIKFKGFDTTFVVKKNIRKLCWNFKK